MPPKKSQSKSLDAKTRAEAKAPSSTKTADFTEAIPSNGTTKDTKPATGTSRKRKARAPSTEPNKAPRRSGRGAQPDKVDPVKMLQYLLSPSSLDLCRPKNEIEDIKDRGENIRTYSASTFTPFEELVCATILSRPIGHMLGLRSIRTIFNPPYEYTTPKKIREAGFDGCREALDQARTQHRQKTAEELVLLANAVADHIGNGEDDVTLETVEEEFSRDLGKGREMLKKNIKGLGKTGLDIFTRRIQADWIRVHPFADEKSLGALEKLGLPNSAKGLRDLITENWATMKADDIKARDDYAKKIKVFVRILERALGAELEGNIESIKAQVT